MSESTKLTAIGLTASFIVTAASQVQAQQVQGQQIQGLLSPQYMESLNELAAMSTPIGAIQTELYNRESVVSELKVFGSLLEDRSANALSVDFKAFLFEVKSKAENEFTVLVPRAAVADRLDTCPAGGFVKCEVVFSPALMEMEGVKVVNGLGEYVTPGLETLMLNIPSVVV